MIQVSPGSYDPNLVAHYVDGFIVIVLGFTGWLLKSIWDDLKSRVNNHEVRLVDLEVLNGVRPERRRPLSEGAE